MREETKRWMDSARDDLKKAEDNFDIPHYDACSFFCQQSVEKILKAAILEKKKMLIKTHDLTHLAKSLGAPPKVMEICKSLGPVYTQTRYPDASGAFKDFSKEQSELDMQNAKYIILWAAKKLS